LDHQVGKQLRWEQFVSMVGKKGVHRPVGDQVTAPACRVQLVIGWVGCGHILGGCPPAAPARTTGSTQPTGSAEPRPFSRLLGRSAEPSIPYLPAGGLPRSHAVSLQVGLGHIGATASAEHRTTTVTSSPPLPAATRPSLCRLTQEDGPLAPHGRGHHSRGQGVGAVMGPPDSGQQRSITVPHGQLNLQLLSRNRP
jgi:hypothetical protein